MLVRSDLTKSYVDNPDLTFGVLITRSSNPLSLSLERIPLRASRDFERRQRLRLRGPLPKLTDKALQTLENLRHLYIGQREGCPSIATVSSS